MTPLLALLAIAFLATPTPSVTAPSAIGTSLLACSNHCRSLGGRMAADFENGCKCEFLEAGEVRP